VLVLRSGVDADLAVARDLLCGAVIVVANPAAGRARLLGLASILLEPPERAELAARLPPEPERERAAGWRPPG
jgi:hypothetical protein